jgi:phage gp45-like
MYHTFLFRLKSNLIASNVDTKDNTDTFLKIIETFVEQEVVSRILRSIGYDDVELLFQSSPYKTKKKWFQSIPVRVRTEKEIEEFVTSVKKPFANTLVPYRVYRETDQSSDSDTEYEEKNRYISLAQNASSEKYFIAVDPEIVRGLRFEWIPEFRVIERYPVSITRDNAHDSEIEKRTNSGRYILLDCKTDTVAKKGVDFHLARFEEIQILAKNQQKVDLQIFLNNKTRKTDNAYVLVSVLHDTYEQWAKKHEKKSISLKEFSSFIEELGYEKKRMTSGMVILVTIVAFEPDEVADCTKAEVGAATDVNSATVSAATVVNSATASAATVVNSATVSAATAIVQKHQTDSEALTAYYDGENLTVNGCTVYPNDNESRERIKSITFAKGLQSIGNDAFRDCPITSVVLPASLKFISYDAFRGCPITSIVLPAGLKEISNDAFRDCPITSVVLPASLKFIGYDAFRGCPITSVEFAEGLQTIGDFAFFECPITSVVLPTSLKLIGNDVFRGCPITSVVLPKGLQCIGNNAFRGCPITSVILPPSLIKIGYDAFQGCPLNRRTVDKLNRYYETDLVFDSGSESDSDNNREDTKKSNLSDDLSVISDDYNNNKPITISRFSEQYYLDKALQEGVGSFRYP